MGKRPRFGRRATSSLVGVLVLLLVIGACAARRPPVPDTAARSHPIDAMAGEPDTRVEASAPRQEGAAIADAAPAQPADADAGRAFALDTILPEGKVKLRIWSLGHAACSLDPLRRAFVKANEGACRVLGVKRATASREPGAAGRAFDGDGCSVWNAGAPPAQGIEAELTLGDHVSAIVLVPEMTPPRGAGQHVIELVEGASTRRRLLLESTFVSNDAYLVFFDDPPAVDRIRILTLAGNSWVAWREVVLFHCDGFIKPPPGATEITPRPARRVVLGRGACRTDADCSRETCCGPRTCVARSLAPACNGVGCGQSCGGDTMECGRGTCICERGTCGAFYPGASRGLQ